MSTKGHPRLIACGEPVGRDTIRYFLYLNGRWRWRPTRAMKALGFGLVTMGRGGPGRGAGGNPTASVEDKARAIELNCAWDMVRAGHAPLPARTTLAIRKAASATATSAPWRCAKPPASPRA